MRYSLVWGKYVLWRWSQTVVVLTFVVAVLNVCLGYALAVYLGFGPPHLSGAWMALRSSPVPDRQATAAAEPIQGAIQQLITGLTEPTEAPGTVQSDTGVPTEEPSAPSQQSQPPEVAQSGLWDLNEKYVEAMVLKLNIAILRSEVKVTELDSRLRACRGQYDLETIRACLSDLRKDCETYLSEQSQLADRFHQRIHELGELNALGEEIEMTNLEQSAQIETTINNLKYMDFESDLTAAGQRLLTEIDNLRAARHKLRDSQELAFLAIARHESRLGHIENQLTYDPLTRLANRIGLETTLWQWWQEGRQRTRQICAALFDLDGFGRLNTKHGSRVGDRILYHVAQLVRGASRENDLVARAGGQRFLVAALDEGPRTVTKNAEMIRQSIERMTFVHDREEIRLTGTSAITEVAPADTHQTLLERLEATLKQARQAGPNQSFFHDGHQAQPVQSPVLGAEYSTIEI